jgi:hypothetical protein
MLLRSVVPKLTQGIKELEVDPSDQKIEPFLSLLKWADVIGFKIVA